MQARPNGIEAKTWKERWKKLRTWVVGVFDLALVGPKTRPCGPSGVAPLSWVVEVQHAGPRSWLRDGLRRRFFAGPGGQGKPKAKRHDTMTTGSWTDVPWAFGKGLAGSALNASWVPRSWPTLEDTTKFAGALGRGFDPMTHNWGVTKALNEVATLPGIEGLARILIARSVLQYWKTMDYHNQAPLFKQFKQTIVPLLEIKRQLAAVASSPSAEELCHVVNLARSVNAYQQYVAEEVGFLPSGDPDNKIVKENWSKSFQRLIGYLPPRLAGLRDKMKEYWRELMDNYTIFVGACALAPRLANTESLRTDAASSELCQTQLSELRGSAPAGYPTSVAGDAMPYNVVEDAGFDSLWAESLAGQRASKRTEPSAKRAALRPFVAEKRAAPEPESADEDTEPEQRAAFWERQPDMKTDTDDE